MQCRADMYSTANHEKDYEKAMEEKFSPSPSCIKCNHYGVCVIARNVTPMMDSLFGMLEKKDQPFLADEIAKLCKWYEHKMEKEEDEK